MRPDVAGAGIPAGSAGDGEVTATGPASSASRATGAVGARRSVGRDGAPIREGSRWSGAAPRPSGPIGREVAGGRSGIRGRVIAGARSAAGATPRSDAGTRSGAMARSCAGGRPDVMPRSDGAARRGAGGGTSRRSMRGASPADRSRSRRHWSASGRGGAPWRSAYRYRGSSRGEPDPLGAGAGARRTDSGRTDSGRTDPGRVGSGRVGSGEVDWERAGWEIGTVPGSRSAERSRSADAPRAAIPSAGRSWSARRPVAGGPDAASGRGTASRSSGDQVADPSAGRADWRRGRRPGGRRCASSPYKDREPPVPRRLGGRRKRGRCGSPEPGVLRTRTTLGHGSSACHERRTGAPGGLRLRVRGSRSTAGAAARTRARPTRARAACAA